MGREWTEAHRREALRRTYEIAAEIEWTEAHKREALRRTFEIAAELTDRGSFEDAEELCMSARMYAETEVNWRVNLAGYEGLDAARIDREVRRVDGLATGRLVRETGRRFYVSQPGNLDEDFATPGGAKLAATQRLQARPVIARVTRIRKAAP